MTDRAIELLEKYLQGTARDIVIVHSREVARMAEEISARLSLSTDERLFIVEAALLHDIGVCGIHAPKLGLRGGSAYIIHGIIGRDILEKEGLFRHALVCERHIGVGLTVDDIDRQGLPLPRRDMYPVDLAEEIVCYADLFYSKYPGTLTQRKTPEVVRNKLAVFGAEKVQKFDEWVMRFGV